MIATIISPNTAIDVFVLCGFLSKEWFASVITLTSTSLFSIILSTF
ncbi:hypothetical protein [Aquibacillus halophilus]|nr:hypothetical protein [Aquibacillus halophilus]